VIEGANIGEDGYYVFKQGKLDVTLMASNPMDVIESSVTYTAPLNVEVLHLTGNAAINATGNAGNNVLIGNQAVNTLTGGLGNDTYVIFDLRDVLIEEAGEGWDTVLSSVSYTLLDNFEGLDLTRRAGNINAFGNSVDNILRGNEGNNTLDGKAGADYMLGGAGNDVYYVDNAGDMVEEYDGQGTDTVYSSVSYSLTDYVENLILTGTAVYATGNALNNSITGNAADNYIDGGAGADVMAGGAGNDIYIVDNTGDKVTEGANAGLDAVISSVSFTLGANIEDLMLVGIDNINAIGNAMANTLTGNDGNNTLDGKAGADYMAGGNGDDFYVVDNIGDVVEENLNEGIDTVQSSISWVLGDYFENLILAGKGSLNGTGNALDNTIVGNGGKNTLYGLAGNDVLVGGGGADTLVGGTGDDIYVVSGTNTVLIEEAGEGTDTVESAYTWTLQENFENLTLTGVTAINGTCNAVGNTIIGNVASKTLDGGAGVDTLRVVLGKDV
jgi:Ca2+-binding RTX toxin-like protein